MINIAQHVQLHPGQKGFKLKRQLVTNMEMDKTKTQFQAHFSGLRDFFLTFKWILYLRGLLQCHMNLNLVFPFGQTLLFKYELELLLQDFYAGSDRLICCRIQTEFMGQPCIKSIQFDINYSSDINQPTSEGSNEIREMFNKKNK